MTKKPTRSDRSEGVLFLSLGEAGLEFTQQLKTIPGAQALYCSQHIHFSSSAGCGEVLRWLLQFRAWKWGRGEDGGGGEGPCFVLFLEWLSPSISAGLKSMQQPSFYATFVGTRSGGHLSLQTRLGGEAPGQGDTLAVTVETGPLWARRPTAAQEVECCLVHGPRALRLFSHSRKSVPVVSMRF